jgi:hypothetical protein
MIRSSVLSLIAVASLTLACTASSDGGPDLGRSASGLEDPSTPLIDYPVFDPPPGLIYPAWGACHDNTRAKRAFVKVSSKFYDPKAGSFVCPEVKGREGVWVGEMVATTRGPYCSYEWKGSELSEYGYLAQIAELSTVNRYRGEAFDPEYDDPARGFWPPEGRPDVRPDCMGRKSPCIVRDGLFDCFEIAPIAPDSAKLGKGMSPCGACGQAISDSEMLVILPDWFVKVDDAAERDLVIETDIGPQYVHPPERDQAFKVKMKGIRPGSMYNIRR